MPAGLRLHRQRPADQFALSVLCRRHPAASITTPTRRSSTSRSRAIDGNILLHTSDVAFTGAVDAATLYRQSAAKAGIKIDIKRDAGRRLLGRCLEQAAVLRLLLGRPPDAGPDAFHRLLSDAAWNDTVLKRPDFDKMRLQARAELDDAKRKQIYREVQLMIHDDGGAIIPMFNDFLFGSARQRRRLGAMATGDDGPALRGAGLARGLQDLAACRAS